MKTLAEFKRAIKVGAKVHTIYHQEFAGRDENGVVLYGDKDRGIREISHVQSNAFTVKTQKADGTYQDLWLHWPKASACRFNDDGSVTMLEPDYRLPQPMDKSVRDDSWRPMIPILTYEVV